MNPRTPNKFDLRHKTIDPTDLPRDLSYSVTPTANQGPRRFLPVAPKHMVFDEWAAVA